MTWEEKLRASREWITLPKAVRKARLKQAQAWDSNLSPDGAPTPPAENPFVVPPGMTPEEATREKIRLDAEQFPVTSRSHSKEIKRRWSMPSAPKVFTGPRGGKYRINRNGRKSYDVP